MHNRLTAASAYWNQRQQLARSRPRLETLIKVLDDPGDLAPRQWAQLSAFALQLAPDLILELGRGRGNSTCAFTELAQDMDGTRVVSVCMSQTWDQHTKRRLEAVVGSTWFEKLQTELCDIRAFDYSSLFKGVRRPLIFWDAHGFAIAETVLGKILPLVSDLPHAVVMHDMSDARYLPAEDTPYGPRGLWTGLNAGSQRYRLGHIDTAVAQAISAVDFTSRNGISLRSADEELHSWFDGSPDRVREMDDLLGPLFSIRADWFWFTLNDAKPPYTFPAVGGRAGVPLKARLNAAAWALLHGPR